MPQTALTPGPDGVYYGTTDSGGATGNGTVYELIPDPAAGSGWTEKVLYAFSGVADGAFPSSKLLLGRDGALYGVTGSGGAQGSGVAFRLAPPGDGQAEWTETTLHSFNGTTDGNAPFGALVADENGVLYGSTVAGGTGSGGVVFSLTPPAMGGAAWTETTLYSFQFGTDGISPTAGLFRDDATGALFGMTSAGGLNGAGEVYRLTPPASGGSAWNKTTLYNFRGVSDGDFPLGGLVRDRNGIFYGVTDSGGLSGWGTVFSLAPPSVSGKGWLETVIYHFSGRLDGGSPDSTLVLDTDGTLYGVTQAGGNMGSGTAFALTPPAPGRRAWTEQALASFDGQDGVNPAGLSAGLGNTLIGTTLYGGSLGNGGTVFTLTPPAPGGSDWTQSVVHDFRFPSTDAVAPTGALLMGRNGALYGSASSGGTHGNGAVYELTPPAGGAAAWQRTLLHSFDGKDGNMPAGTLLEGAGGVLYGVTSNGGPKSATLYGTVYALHPPAAGKTDWTEQILHVFTGVGDGDGSFPASGLIADSSGALYGTAGSGGVARATIPSATASSTS